MEEYVFTATDDGQETAPCGAPPEAYGDAELEADGAADEETARGPDVGPWLPGGSVWLYAVPVILLLFLWLFYPVVLVLICIILAIWWLG